MRKFVISPKGIAAELLLIVLAAALLFGRANAEKTAAVAEEKEDDYIKWVEFNVSYEALDKAYQYDVDTYGKEPHLDWIELLSYLGAKYGGDFTSYKAGDMDALAEQLSQDGADMEALTKDMQYYEYYHEAYESVLGGMVGTFKIQGEDGKYTETYGLKAYHPIAKGFPYGDYDDFGVSRTYGYKRNHLGHDMMGQVGTPICIINRIHLKRDA